MKIGQGLKEISKRDLLPEGRYRMRIDSVRATRDGTGENAHLIVVDGPDPEVRGKKTLLYLGSEVTGNYIGLSQVLASLQLFRPPGGDHGESDTHNLAGLEFDADVVIEGDRDRVHPVYDADWLNKVKSGEITEDTPKKKGGRGRH